MALSDIVHSIILDCLPGGGWKVVLCSGSAPSSVYSSSQLGRGEKIGQMVATLEDVIGFGP